MAEIKRTKKFQGEAFSSVPVLGEILMMKLEVERYKQK